jgi:O-antigen/teichoic acid export membrane protein
MALPSGEPPAPQKNNGGSERRQPFEPDDDRPATYDNTLRRKTRWSILWTVLRILSDQVFAFVIFVILARLLSPAEFGIFAIAQAVAEIGRAIAIGGMSQNIPRAKKLTPALADTVFWTNLVSALVLAFAVLLLAPPVMDALDLSHATGAVQGLGFVLPIVALGATHLSLRLREFGHKSLALRSVASGTLGGAAGIAAALAGWGIWALVVQRLATEVTNMVMSWQAYPWVPGRNFSLAQLRAIWPLGFNMTLHQILSLLPRRAMDLIIGSMIGAAAVGLNRTARRSTELILAGTVNPFTAVATQTLSRLQGDSTEMIRAYRWMVSRSAMLTCPALIGFGVLAPDAVPAVFGAKWTISGDLARIFAFMVVPYAISGFTWPMLLALGRGATLRTYALTQLISTIALGVAAAPFGLIAVAWVSVLASYVALPFQLLMLRKALGLRPQDALRAIAAPLMASLAMGGGVWALMEMIRPHFTPILIPIFICVVAGMGIYAILIYVISKEARTIVRHQLKAFRARFPAGA